MTFKGRPEQKNVLKMSRLDRVITLFDQFVFLVKFLFVLGKKHWHALPKPHRVGISVLGGCLFLLIVWPNNDSFSTSETQYYQDEERLTDDFDLDDDDDFEPSLIKEDEKPTPDQNEEYIAEPEENEELAWVSHRVAPGDTLAGIFRAQNLPLPDLYAITAIEGKEKPLSHIKPGQQLRFKRNLEGKIDKLHIETQEKMQVIFSRLSDGRFVRL